jgi:perosamine synthetase
VGKRLQLFKPYMPNLNGIKKLLKSGNLSYGKYGRLFEDSLKSFLEIDTLCTISSYNIAFFAIFASIGLKYGDEVVMSPVACLESTQPVKAFGLKIKWVDVDAKTGTLSPKSLNDAISKNTKLIIHNHFCGNVGYIDEINKIGKKYNIPVIDDCIEAFGAEYNGRKLGNVGTDYTIFSFSFVRFPNTLSGALIVTNRENITKILKIRDNGIDRVGFRLENGEINPEHDINIIGYSGLMSEFNSFIGLKQMKEVSKILKKQRNNANIWNMIYDIQGNKIESIYKNNLSLPNYWVFGILTNDKIRLMEILASKGFKTSSVHINSNIYSIFEKNNPVILEGVNEFTSKFLALPSGWWVKKYFLTRFKIENTKSHEREK